MAAGRPSAPQTTGFQRQRTLGTRGIPILGDLWVLGGGPCTFRGHISGHLVDPRWGCHWLPGFWTHFRGTHQPFKSPLKVERPIFNVLAVAFNRVLVEHGQSRSQVQLNERLTEADACRAGGRP